VGTLLVAYFVDIKRDTELENLKNFLRGLRDGKEGTEALAVLLNGRTMLELEEDIRKAWRGKGVDFTFSKD